MFSLLLLPPICGFILFLGLLTASRRPVVRALLSLVLTGLVVPVVGGLAHRVLADVPVVALLMVVVLLTTSLLWRVIPLLPVPTRHVRGICWLLVLTSCTLTTALLTSAAPVTLHLPLAGNLLHLPLAGNLLVLALPFLAAHLVLSLFDRPAQSQALAPAARPKRPQPVGLPALPLLSRPLELVGAGAPYYPLAASLTAGTGPAAAFSSN